jgi:hypothetical protein
MPRHHYTKPSKAELQLRAEADKLTTTIVCLRRELEDKEGACQRLEILLRERLGRIDQLTGTIDRLRDQNRRLDQECEHLAEMVRLPPPLVAS